MTYFKEKIFKSDDIQSFLDKTREAIYEVQAKSRVENAEICVYIPDYFITILNMYFHGRFYGLVGFIGFDSTTTASFYGVKNFYPSPTNEIIVSHLQNPKNVVSVAIFIKL